MTPEMSLEVRLGMTGWAEVEHEDRLQGYFSAVGFGPLAWNIWANANSPGILENFTRKDSSVHVEFPQRRKR